MRQRNEVGGVRVGERSEEDAGVRVGVLGF